MSTLTDNIKYAFWGKRKPKTPEDKEQEAKAAELFGRHVTTEKFVLMLVFSALVCMVPVIVGLRLWNTIPELIATGLTRANGEDDPLPRWMLVYLVPGLFCLLDVINNVQFLRFQKMKRLPPRHTVFMGRWGFPLISLVVCGWAIPWGAGLSGMTTTLLVWWLIAWAIMVLGAEWWDCPRDSKLAIRFLAVCRESETGFRTVHRIFSVIALSVGLALSIVGALFTPMA